MLTTNEIDLRARALLLLLSQNTQTQIGQEQTLRLLLQMMAVFDLTIEQHMDCSRDAAIERLLRVERPPGPIRFPEQSLAVPVTLPSKCMDFRINSERLTYQNRVFWFPTGAGWILPTQLELARKNSDSDPDFCLLSLSIVPSENSDDSSGLTRLMKDPGQLLFAALPDALVTAIEQGDWFCADEAGVFRTAKAARYEGFLDFEARLCALRAEQRQLDSWRPFFPYSRKILHLQSAGATLNRSDLPDWIHSIFHENAPSDGIQFFGRIQALVSHLTPYWSSGSTHTAGGPFVLNAVPVLQSSWSKLTAKSSGTDGRVEFRQSKPGAYYLADVRGSSDQPYRAWLELSKANEDTVISTDELGDQEVIAYLYDLGDRNTEADPEWHRMQIRFQDIEFDLPFPLLGGAGLESEIGEGRMLSRTPLRNGWLTSFDIERSALERCTGPLKGLFDQVRTEHRLEVSDNAAGSPWRCYLWPTFINNDEYFENAKPKGEEDYIPFAQWLRLYFRVADSAAHKGMEFPPFLIQDAADYLASTMPGYSMAGALRIEAVVE